MELSAAGEMAAEIVRALQTHCERIDIAGSIRRGRPGVGDTDIVAIPRMTSGQALLGSVADVRETDFYRELRTMLDSISGEGQKVVRGKMRGVPVDVYLATPETWATLLLIRTGFKEHNIWNFPGYARAARNAQATCRFGEGPKKLRGKVRERENRKAKLGTLTRDFSLRGGALGLTFLLSALFFCGSGAAQTVPHVTGTFKTPGNQTPQAAGLRSIATIGATAVYGSVDFQPYDSSGNKPTRILCGGVTYIPQKVRAWIKGDGTLVDNATGAAGLDLVPTQGCTPAGLVMRATITLAPSSDGRIASLTWTEDKSLPQQASVDWGSLAAAGITAPTYTGYSTIENGGVALPARSILNFLGGGCTDNASMLATDCPTGGGGGGATIETNGVSNTSQAVLNFQNSSKISFSNPASGNEQATIVAASIQDADLAGSISASKISGTAETQNNKNAASGYAGLDAGGKVAKAQLPATSVFTDQANSYTAGTKQSVASSATTAGLNLASLSGQPSTPASGDLNNNAGFLELYNGAAWKRVAYTDSSITGTAAALAANGTNCAATLFAKGVDASGNAECAQPAFSDLSGGATAAQMLGLTNAHIYVGNGSNQPADVALSGDASLANTGAITVGKVNGTSVPTNAAADQAIVTTAAATGAWKSLPACSNATTDKLMYDTATHAFSCGTDQTGAAGGGITTLNTLTATTQTFAKTDDTNVTLSITSSASTHTFALGWTGQLANARGGTGVNSSSSTGVPRVNAGSWTFDAKTINLADFSSTAPTADGKIPIWNQSAQQYQPGDPVVSWNNGTAQTAAWTSATTVDSAVTASLTSPVNMSLVIVTVRASSTMTAGTLNFEADDGSGNFSFPVACDRLDSATVETSFALSVTNKAWQCNVAGMSQFRVRLNPAITGTGTANIRVIPTTAPVEAQTTVQQASGANLHVNVDSAPTTAITASSLPLPTGAATDATLAALEVAQGSTTSGQKGILDLGAVSTAAPSYTNGQTSALSLDTSGSLRVNCTAGCGGGTGGTAMSDQGSFTQGTTQFTPIGGEYTSSPTTLTSGQAGAARMTSDRMLMNDLEKIGGSPFAQGQRTMANSISFVPASDYSSPDTLGSGIALNALNAAASVATNAQQGAGVFIAGGTLTATVVPEVSYDGGTTWVGSAFYDPSARTVSASLSLTNPNAATSLTILVPGGASNARVRVSSFTSGTANATVRATLAREIVLSAQAVTQSGAPWSENITQIGGTAIDTNSGNKSAGTLRVVLSTDQPQLTNPLLTTETPGTSGGYSISRTISAASTNSTNAKATAGQVYGAWVFNTNASPRYLKLYNKATAPTCGTDTPVVTVLIPGNTAGAGAVPALAAGAAFSSGIGYCITAGAADSDTTAVAANEVIVNLFYK